MNEMEQPQISKSPFQILFVYDVSNNEIVYEMEEQHKVEEKEFRFFKTRGQETDHAAGVACCQTAQSKPESN